jgi:hypothetical protein
VRAELDAGGVDFSNIDRPEFGVLSKRIHDLLFADGRPKEAASA